MNLPVLSLKIISHEKNAITQTCVTLGHAQVHVQMTYSFAGQVAETTRS